jgi:hypothetical protein
MDSIVITVAAWLDRRRTDRSPVFQAGTGFLVSSGRFHPVDYRRDYPALYLGKISGLRVENGILALTRWCLMSEVRHGESVRRRI